MSYAKMTCALLAALALLSAGELSKAQAQVAPGVYKITAPYSGKSLIVNPRDPYGVDPGGPDTIWHCSYVLFPRYGQWRLIPVPDPNRPGQFLPNRFFILNTFSGKVMDVPGFATGVCKIQQFGRNNGTNQQWQLEPVSKLVGPIIVTNYRIRSVSSGLVDRKSTRLNSS